MTAIIRSPQCQDGNHNQCTGGQAAPGGAFGGWKCNCSCHISKYKPGEGLKNIKEIQKADKGRVSEEFCKKEKNEIKR